MASRVLTLTGRWTSHCSHLTFLGFWIITLRECCNNQLCTYLFFNAQVNDWTHQQFAVNYSVTEFRNMTVAMFTCTKIAYPIFTSVDRKFQIHCSHSWSQTKLWVSELFFEPIRLKTLQIKNASRKHVNCKFLIRFGPFRKKYQSKGVVYANHYSERRPCSHPSCLGFSTLRFAAADLFLASRKPTESEAK